MKNLQEIGPHIIEAWYGFGEDRNNITRYTDLPELVTADEILVTPERFELLKFCTNPGHCETVLNGNLLPAGLFKIDTYSGTSYSRMLEIIHDPRIKVLALRQGENNYGEFWWIALNLTRHQSPLIFYGLGENWSSGRAMLNFSEPQDSSVTKANAELLDKSEVLATLERAYRALSPKPGPQTKEQKAYEFLAELTDEDGAETELMDDPGIADLFDDD